jgi:acetyltransferase EpsM
VSATEDDAARRGRDLPLLVLGTTEFAATVSGSATDAGFRVAGFVENLLRERCDEPLLGLPVHWIDDVAPLARSHLGICGIGTTARSAFVAQAEERGLRFATVVHPRAYVSPTATIGEGTYVGPHAAISGHTRIGRHVLVLQGALVGHHVEIGDFASILMGANVAGSSRIGEATYVATSAVVIDHVDVGSHSVVGAGAVVVSDVPDHVQVLGVPARVVKTDVAGR